MATTQKHYVVEWFAKYAPAGTDYRIVDLPSKEEVLKFVKNWIGFDVHATVNEPDGTHHDINSAEDYIKLEETWNTKQ